MSEKKETLVYQDTNMVINDTTDLEEAKEKSKHGEFFQEAKTTMSLAWPIVIMLFSEYSFAPTATAFSGHLGKMELDTVALGNSIINVTGLMIVNGMCTACDTLFSQTYGSINRQNMGVILQQSLLIMVLTTLLCWTIHLNAEPILLLFRQNHEVARLCGDYLLYFMPGMLFFSLYIPLMKFLITQNVVLPNLGIGLLGNGMCILSNYLLMYVFKMDTRGSAISQSVGYLTMLLLTLAYILISGVYKATWTGWDSRCLENWSKFVSLGVFGMFMVCIEWWSFEVGIFLAGSMGMTELAAQTVSFQVSVLSYMFPLGMSISCSIRIGQFLGAGDTVAAKLALKVSLIITCTGTAIWTILVVALRLQLAHIFTNIPSVIKLTSVCIIVVGLYTIPCGITSIATGVMKGMGRQRDGFVIAIVVYTIGVSVGIPVMLRTHLGVVGWFVVAAGWLSVQAVVVWIFVSCVYNWDNEVILAQERTKISHRNQEVYTSKESGSINTSLLAFEEDSASLRRLVFQKSAIMAAVAGILVLGLAIRLTLPLSRKISCPRTNFTTNCNYTNGINEGL